MPEFPAWARGSVILAVLCCPAVSQAETESEDESRLMDLTLEELLSVRSTVAGRVPEPALQVPGSVKVHTDQDIQRYGVYSIADLADLTPGYSSYTIFGERVLSTRGQKAGSFNNNKHLLLVDGIPVNHAKGNKASIDYELPLFFARQVEFLSGPSSALYGTGAFLGVVSIVPKELELPSSLVEGHVGAGTLDFDKHLYANALYRDARATLSLNLGLYSKNASGARAGDGSDPLFRNWDDQDSLFLRVAYDAVSGPIDGLGAGVIYLDKSGGLGEFWTGDFSSELNDLRWTTLVPYVRFRKRLRDYFEISSYLKYNLSREAGDTVPFNRSAYDDFNGTGPVFSTYDQFVHEVEAQVELKLRPTREFEFISGYDVDTRRQADARDEGHSAVLVASDVPLLGGEPAETNPRVTTLSTYAQARIRLPVLEELSLIAGGRLDGSLTDEEQFARLSPRFGFVQQLTPGFALKAFYSTALRAPGVKEYGLNEEARATLEAGGGNADGIAGLKAETHESVEVTAVVIHPQLMLEGSFFLSRTDAALNGVRYEEQNIFANSSESVRTLGTTADARVRLGPLDLMASYGYSTPFDDSVAEEVPVHDLRGGFSFSSEELYRIRATAWVRWVSGFREPGTADRASDGLTQLNANLLVPVHDHTQLELFARNLLGRDDFYPFNGKKQVPLPERAVHVSVSYKTN
jgi:outer membrane receptor for ferrienterochelin and colicins